MKQNVEICSGCIARSSEGTRDNLSLSKKEFLEKVLSQLQEKRPDIEWNLSTTSCLRICPPQRLSIVVANRMGMTRGNTVEGVVEDILARLIRPQN